MQDFIDHKLTLRASREFRRVVVGRTEQVTMENGDGKFSVRWRYKKMRYFANFALVTQETRDELTGAFHAAGMAYLFRFRDPGDYTVTDAPLTVVAGTKTPVQLIKRYYFGSTAYGDRIIQAVDHCVLKTLAGVEVHGTLDNVRGLFTPTNNWADTPHKWSGRYCNWVRFASDEFDSTMVILDIATADVELHEGRAHR